MKSVFTNKIRRKRNYIAKEMLSNHYYRPRIVGDRRRKAEKRFNIIKEMGSY